MGARVAQLDSARPSVRKVPCSIPRVTSHPLFLFICLDPNKFVLLSVFSLIKTIYPRVSTKPLPNDAKKCG